MQTDREISNRLISLREAAEILACTPRTVRRFGSEGLLTVYRVGSKIVRVNRLDVEAMAKPIFTTSGAGLKNESGDANALIS